MSAPYRTVETIQPNPDRLHERYQLDVDADQSTDAWTLARNMRADLQVD